MTIDNIHDNAYSIYHIISIYPVDFLNILFHTNLAQTIFDSIKNKSAKLVKLIQVVLLRI
jgi:hypothetical protein